jgi:hypothetical protein
MRFRARRVCRERWVRLVPGTYWVRFDTKARFCAVNAGGQRARPHYFMIDGQVRFDHVISSSGRPATQPTHDSPLPGWP